jgi:hypothetical protein
LKLLCPKCNFGPWAPIGRPTQARAPTDRVPSRRGRAVPHARQEADAKLARRRHLREATAPGRQQTSPWEAGGGWCGPRRWRRHGDKDAGLIQTSTNLAAGSGVPRPCVSTSRSGASVGPNTSVGSATPAPSITTSRARWPGPPHASGSPPGGVGASMQLSATQSRINSRAKFAPMPKMARA